VFSLRVQTENVKAWQDVALRINNVNSSNFNFSDEGVVTTNIGLKEGVNNVEVSAKNESGTKTERTLITYIKPVKINPPVIFVQIPASDPFNTFESYEQMRALITGIKDKQDISVSVNG